MPENGSSIHLHSVGKVLFGIIPSSVTLSRSPKVKTDELVKTNG